MHFDSHMIFQTNHLANIIFKIVKSLPNPEKIQACHQLLERKKTCGP